MNERAQFTHPPLYIPIVLVISAFAVVIIVDTVAGPGDSVTRCVAYFGENASYVGAVSNKQIDVCRLANGSLEVVPKNFTVS